LWPVQSLPTWLADIINYFPVAAGAEGARGVLLRGKDIIISLQIMVNFKLEKYIALQ